MADSDARAELETAKAEIGRLQAENVTLRMKVRSHSNAMDMFYESDSSFRHSNYPISQCMDPAQVGKVRYEVIRPFAD